MMLEITKEVRIDAERLVELIKKLPEYKQEFISGYVQGYIDKKENDRKEKSA